MGNTAIRVTIISGVLLSAYAGAWLHWYLESGMMHELAFAAMFVYLSVMSIVLTALAVIIE